jgi:hypothetical protein
VRLIGAKAPERESRSVDHDVDHRLLERGRNVGGGNPGAGTNGMAHCGL